MVDIIKHAALHMLGDCLHLVPFLFAAYLLIELIEHKAGDRAAAAINRAGRYGPLVGAALGIVPQCGFSAVMSNFYAGGLITKGTLLAVFLSTSDEMLPILLSENVAIQTVLKILALKLFIGALAGFAVDAVMKKAGSPRTAEIGDICRDSHCHCEEGGILKSALHHTVQTAVFIAACTFVLNIAVEFIGEEAIGGFILNRPVIGEILAGAIGLIPNCASSIVITQLYVEGYLSAGAMLSGLCAGSGVGLLVLFRVNRDVKDNLKTLALLYVTGVAAGIIFGALPIF